MLFTSTGSVSESEKARAARYNANRERRRKLLQEKEARDAILAAKQSVSVAAQKVAQAATKEKQALVASGATPSEAKKAVSPISHSLASVKKADRDLAEIAEEKKVTVQSERAKAREAALLELEAKLEGEVAPPPPVRKPGRKIVPIALPPLSKPKTPVSKPKTPVSKPKTPVSKPKTPVPKPKTPVSKPKTPVSKPKTPVSKPKTPVPKPKTPVSKAKKPKKSKTSKSKKSKPSKSKKSSKPSHTTLLNQTTIRRLIIHVTKTEKPRISAKFLTELNDRVHEWVKGVMHNVSFVIGKCKAKTLTLEKVEQGVALSMSSQEYDFKAVQQEIDDQFGLDWASYMPVKKAVRECMLQESNDQFTRVHPEAVLFMQNMILLRVRSMLMEIAQMMEREFLSGRSTAITWRVCPTLMHASSPDMYAMSPDIVEEDEMLIVEEEDETSSSSEEDDPYADFFDSGSEEQEEEDQDDDEI